MLDKNIDGGGGVDEPMFRIDYFDRPTVTATVSTDFTIAFYDRTNCLPYG